MNQHRTTLTASALVIASGVVWGFYWLPVRALSQAGLPGAWGTVAITVSAVLVLCPIAFGHRQSLRDVSPFSLCAVALGGAAFALYSVGFVYGRVAIVVLLFFLTPVWSTLIGHFFFGWTTPPLRILAMIVGLIGLGIILGADGNWPVPRNIGEWMGLVSGMLWSISSVGMRRTSTLLPTVAAFVFACGAALTACLIAGFLAPLPLVSAAVTISAIALVTGALWWGAVVIGLMWATVRLEPARTGILLMSEVLVAAASAAIIAGEQLSVLELIGGVLVLGAGILELWPTNTGRPAPPIYSPAKPEDHR